MLNNKQVKLAMLLSLFCLSILFSQCSWGAILFEDNFDNHDDWGPVQPSSGQMSEECGIGCTTAPDGYAGWRMQASAYNNSKNSTMEIDSTNYRGASGKALTYWSELCDNCGWASDGLLNIELDSVGFPELYVRLFIKFQPGWQWATSTSPIQKFLHISHFNGGNPFTFFQDGSHGPLFIPDLAKWGSGTYPIAYFSSYRFENTYYPASATPSHSSSDNTYFKDTEGTSMDFWDAGMIGDGQWHCLEFYLKLNTVVGVADGEHKFWFDGKLIANITGLAWGDEGAQVSPRKQWNYVQIGGNNNNPYALQSGEPEQWYAIDDIVISTTYIGPDYVIGGTDTVIETDKTAPAPPTGLTIINVES